MTSRLKRLSVASQILGGRPPGGDDLHTPEVAHPALEWAIALYLGVRLLVPVGLILFAGWGASPRRRIALIRAFLLAGTPRRRPPEAERSTETARE